MKKKVLQLFSAFLCGAMLTVASPIASFADECKIVTLGVDLSKEQQDTMLRYFQVNPQEVQIIYVTNKNEREMLGSYIPLSKIGTRTLSCAYVNPTSQGGIKVRTANLNYVTCNMLASALSTAGVNNAEVIAACPFEVSGTGALTGVMLAYEDATGTKLDDNKKDLATEEMVQTGILGDHTQDDKGNIIGRDPAIDLINQAKIIIIRDNVTDYTEIHDIFVNLVVENNYSISDSYLTQIVDLLKKIADQNYDYDEVGETLENIDKNLNASEEENTEGSDEEVKEETPSETPEADPDSIFDGIDEGVLGDDVIASDTTDASLQEETMKEDEVIISGFDSEPVTPEEFIDQPSDEIAPETEDAEGEAANAEDEGAAGSIYELLTDDQKAFYEKAESFADGEFLGDLTSLHTVMDEDFVPSASVGEEDSQKLCDAFLEYYGALLLEGTDSYIPGAEDIYFTPELNLISKDLLAVFDLSEDPEAQNFDILSDYDSEIRQSFYEDSMKFFEKLYGEIHEEADSFEEEAVFTVETTEQN